MPRHKDKDKDGKGREGEEDSVPSPTSTASVPGSGFYLWPSSVLAPLFPRRLFSEQQLHNSTSFKALQLVVVLKLTWKTKFRLNMLSFFSDNNNNNNNQETKAAEMGIRQNDCD